MSSSDLKEMKTDPSATITEEVGSNKYDLELQEPAYILEGQLPTDEVPDGGLMAWLQVVAVFMLYLNTWGVANSFGAYQTYYGTVLMPSQSPSSISWIGSTQGSIIMFLGVVTGPMFDRGYCRSMVIVGSVLVTLGFMMLSLCKTYTQTMLAQGVCIGLGQSLMLIPSMAILPQYFKKHLGFAVGIVATGSPVGGIVFSIALRKMIVSIGFGWAVRVLGFISFVTLVGTSLIIRPRILPPPSKLSFRINLDPYKSWPYFFFCLSQFIGFLSFYIPIYYIGLYATQKELTSADTAYWVIPALEACSIIGRLCWNFVADRVGRHNIFVISAILPALVAFCWIPVNSQAGIFIIGSAWGFVSGPFVSLAPAVLADITPDVRILGQRNGLTNFVNAITNLIGTPIAGAILGANYNWVGLQCFTGANFLLTSALVVCLRVSFGGWSVNKKI